MITVNCPLRNCLQSVPPFAWCLFFHHFIFSLSPILPSMSTYFSLGNPELDFASNTISQMLNEGSKLLSSLSGCTLSNVALFYSGLYFQMGIELAHILLTHQSLSLSLCKVVPSQPVPNPDCRVIPSQMLSFALPSGSHVPLRSGPDSPSISSRWWGWSRIFSVYFHYNSTTLLMFSFLEVSACVEPIHPTSMKMY